ncbi:AAA family ATPase [Xaviernesmea oryzae]|uniref:AAA family ATPase n=1 Tax=Xaviernesmea oryzae TaxID=464029 RepID=UPI00094F9A95|nr:AAA family ATPase [Xaviernesmea oryzae]
MINGLLECLDPSKWRKGVVVVGATNNPDVIDRALLRSGRLETLVEILLLDGKARVAISSPSPSSSPSKTNLPNRPSHL